MLEQRQTPKGTAVSAGYPSIERLMDTEDFSTVNDTFAAAYGELTQTAKVKRGLKKSREAKKAMLAIELTMNLFKELLEIKYKIAEMLKRSQTKKV